MQTKISWKRLVIVVVLGIALLAVNAYSGTTQTVDSETTPIAIGTILNSELFDGPATVTVRQLKILPGEVLAWHYHPGRAYNVIKSGTLTVEDGCGGEDLVVINTFIVPQGSPTTINTPGNQRLCGPPESVDECKNGGWLNFTHPRTFNSKGDCIHYVRNGN